MDAKPHISMTYTLFKEEAESRGWTCDTLPGGCYRISIPGQSKPIVTRGAITEVTSSPSMRLMSSKALLGRFLEQLSFSHPKTVYFGQDNLSIAEDFMKEHRRIVVKPDNASQGRGATMGVDTIVDLKKAALLASFGKSGTTIIAQEDVSDLGEYRIGVLFGEVKGALKGGVTTLTGDGVKTIGEILAEKFETIKHRYLSNSDTRRKLITDSFQSLIAMNDSDRVMAVGEHLSIKNPMAFIKDDNIRISVKDIHPSIKNEIIRLCDELNAPISGIDIFLEDHTKPMETQRHYFMEANPAPGIGSYENPKEAVTLILDKVIQKRAQK